MRLFTRRIEHLWSELERRIQNIRRIRNCLTGRGAQIPEYVYVDLVKSMPRRIEACIVNKGWPTKY